MPNKRNKILEFLNNDISMEKRLKKAQRCVKDVFYTSKISCGLCLKTPLFKQNMCRDQHEWGKYSTETIVANAFYKNDSNINSALRLSSVNVVYTFYTKRNEKKFNTLLIIYGLKSIY